MEQNTRRKPTIVVLDNNRDRCLRQEATLDKAIEAIGIIANGMSNFGGGYIARTGIPVEKLPCVEIDDLVYFPPNPNEEITYGVMCRLLETLVANGVLERVSDKQPKFPDT